MFGYVRPFKPEMKFCEFDAYKSVYCALCKALGREYGVITRLTLSYDGTFVALVGAALCDGRAEVCKGRCVCNPLKKCVFYAAEGTSVSYAAAVNVLLSAARCRDAMQDARGFKRLRAGILSLLLHRAEKKAAQREPVLAEQIRQQMARQQRLEQASCAVPDEAAEPTAQMLSAILEHFASDDAQRRILNVLGYQLGRWVYLADALDDLTDDLRQHQYNPLIARFSLSTDASEIALRPVIQYAKEVMSADEARLSGAYALLELHRLTPVLDNLIHLGLPSIRKQLPRQQSKQKQEAQHERPL